MSAEPTEQDVQNGFEERLRQRKDELENHPLSTVPKTRAYRPGGTLPNTPLTASTISFVLGWAFSLGVLTFLRGGFGSWWNSYQLGFFVAAWSGFHWGEFAVTAGWNLEKCSIDCTYDCCHYIHATLRTHSVLIDKWQCVPHRERSGCHGTRNSHVFPAFMESKPIRHTDWYGLFSATQNIYLVTIVFRNRNSAHWPSVEGDGHDPGFNKLLSHGGAPQSRGASACERGCIRVCSLL